MGYFLFFYGYVLLFSNVLSNLKCQINNLKNFMSAYPILFLIFKLLHSHVRIIHFCLKFMSIFPS
jgi:hypothetical protein